MTSPRHSRVLRYLSVFALCFAMLVIMKGAYTRLVDAGLGCPDWPGCYGMLGVPQATEDVERAEALYPDSPVEADKGWPEMIHRYIAATLGLFILIMAGLSLKQQRPGMKGGVPNISLHASALLAMVILQGLFGMWTVTLKLWPQVVTAHLLGGFATLSLLALMSWRIWVPTITAAHNQLAAARRLRPLIVLAIVVLVVQIALGGWMSANYAALACVDLPTCHGSYWPAMNFSRGFDFTQHVGPNYLGGMLDSEARVAIHFTHRVGAIVTTLVLLWLIVGVYRNGQPILQRLALVAGVLLTIQVALGITNVLAFVPLWSAVLHNAVAALLLVCLFSILYVQTVLQPSASLDHNKDNMPNQSGTYSS
ncbi:COX15/CtaA family protein [Allohahella marinimesophila]|uniref:COX15/CtaA family protein n=1 Tax=Allohahella marinimesophila TaxID=1054972 RepID=A0ABP7PD30_9GAMM